MSTATAESSVVRLEWSLKDGDVVVTPCDQDRFILRRNRAIAILQQGAEVEKFGHQFNILLRTLAEWLKNRSEISKAYLTDRDGALAFVVVRKVCRYDDAFEDIISELDYRVANDPDLDLIKMDIIALPLASDNAISSFINPGFSFQYVGHGDGSGSYSTGQQEPRRTAAST
jgi:hypothetical protein